MSVDMTELPTDGYRRSDMSGIEENVDEYADRR
jgi:hypothetical protein